MIGLRNVAEAQGGVEAHVRNLARELDNLGLNVAVSVRTPYAPRDQKMLGTGIKIVRLWAPRSKSAEALVHSLISILYAALTRPRLVHIHAIGPSIVLPLARLLGLKVVATHHGEDYRREKWGPFARLVLRWGEVCQARLAHRVICVSKSLSGRLTEQYGRYFHYIPNGVSPPEGKSGTDVLSELGLEPGRYLLTVSRLVPEKRHLDLIEAFCKMGNRDLKLVIVGSADHRSSYAKSLAAEAARTPGVVLAGFRTGDQLQSLFENSAVFVLPSSHEGLPIALLEAMSHGCKVIASDITANTDLGLREENYHRLGDTDDLSRKIAYQVSQPDARQDWSTKLQQFRWDTIALKSLELYRDVDPAIASETLAADVREDLPNADFNKDAPLQLELLARPFKPGTKSRRGDLVSSRG
jgi:glycosyltransferase involved in cell wall biosynthesis